MIAVPIIALVLVLIVASAVWQWTKSQSSLEKWARAQGYELVSQERRLMRRGPYWWRTGKGQEVFYITVRDSAGRLRRGHARVGGFLLGQFSGDVDVTWE